MLISLHGSGRGEKHEHEQDQQNRHDVKRVVQALGLVSYGIYLWHEN